MEVDGIGIVLVEEAECVYQVVLVAKQAPHAAALLVGHSAEALLCHPFVFLHQVVVDKELLHTILAGVEERLRAGQAVLHHRLAYLEGGVEHDAVVTVEHLGIHATHRGADDQVGLLGLAHPMEQVESLLGM